jgi:hypothetical protein
MNKFIQFPINHSPFSMDYRLPITDEARSYNGKLVQANAWSIVNREWSIAPEGGA